MKTIIAQLFPNNEIRLGWNNLPHRPKNLGDNRPTKDRERFNHLLQESLNEVCSGIGTDYLWDKVSGRMRLLSKVESASTRQRLSHILDITSKVQHAENEQLKRRKPYGIPQRAKRFTRRARHRLLQGAAIAERWAGRPGRCALVTLTLPGGTEAAKRIISEWSGYLVNRILQVVRRSKVKVGWFYAWEWQKRGALHLHLAITTQHEMHSMALGRVVERQWWKALCSIPCDDAHEVFTHESGDKCTASEYWQSDTRLCERGLANYLSKYISKETTKETKGFEGRKATERYYPSRWYGMSRWLSQEIDRQTVTLRWEDVTSAELTLCESLMDDFAAHSFVNYAHHNLSDIVWKKKGRNEVGELFEEVVHLGSVSRRIIYHHADSRAEAVEGLKLLCHMFCDWLSSARVSGDIGFLSHKYLDKVELTSPTTGVRALHPCKRGFPTASMQ